MKDPKEAKLILKDKASLPQKEDDNCLVKNPVHTLSTLNVVRNELQKSLHHHQERSPFKRPLHQNKVGRAV